MRKKRTMISPLPPYTIAVYKTQRRELVAVKRISGHWDIAGLEEWFESDEELFEAWPDLEIIGEGIWPQENGLI
jgi:hypothetical protein